MSKMAETQIQYVKKRELEREQKERMFRCQTEQEEKHWRPEKNK